MCVRSFSRCLSLTSIGPLMRCGGAESKRSSSGTAAIRKRDDERSDADFLRRHMLEVPIHQDVTLEAVDYMAEQIIKLGVGVPA